MVQIYNYNHKYNNENGNEVELYSSRFSIFDIQKLTQTNDDKEWTIDNSSGSKRCLICFNWIADTFFAMPMEDDTYKTVFGKGSWAEKSSLTDPNEHFEKIMLKSLTLSEMLQQRENLYQIHNKTNATDKNDSRPYLDFLTKLLIDVDPNRRGANYEHMVKKFNDTTGYKVYSPNNEHMKNFDWPTIQATTANIDNSGWSKQDGGAVSSEIVSLLHLLEYRNSVNNNFVYNVLPTLKGGASGTSSENKSKVEESEDSKEFSRGVPPVVSPTPNPNPNAKPNPAVTAAVNSNKPDITQGTQGIKDPHEELCRLMELIKNTKWQTKAEKLLKYWGIECSEKKQKKTTGGASAFAPGTAPIPGAATLGWGDAAKAAASAAAMKLSGYVSSGLSGAYGYASSGLSGAYRYASSGLSNGWGMAAAHPWIAAGIGGIVLAGLIYKFQWYADNPSATDDLSPTHVDTRENFIKYMYMSYSDLDFELTNFVTNTKTDLTLYNRLIAHADKTTNDQLAVYIRKLAYCVAKAEGMRNLIRKNPEILTYNGDDAEVRAKIRNKIGRYGTRKANTDKKIKDTMLRFAFGPL